MKKFLKGVVEWKTSACMIFTAAMFFYLFFCWVYGTREVSTGMLWTLFWASACASLIQAVCFSDWIIKKLRYTWRSLLFVALGAAFYSDRGFDLREVADRLREEGYWFVTVEELLRLNGVTPEAGTMYRTGRG